MAEPPAAKRRCVVLDDSEDDDGVEVTQTRTWADRDAELRAQSTDCGRRRRAWQLRRAQAASRLDASWPPRQVGGGGQCGAPAPDGEQAGRRRRRPH